MAQTGHRPRQIGKVMKSETKKKSKRLLKGILKKMEIMKWVMCRIFLEIADNYEVGRPRFG